MDLSAIEISAAGMRAQRARMDLIAANLANADLAPVREGGSDAVRPEAYRRKVATVVEGPRGLPTLRVTEDAGPVNSLTEMVDLIAASRAYEANLTAVEVAKSMHQSTLRILG
jgi:flagellar basal-body rod protein FlgC